MKYSSATGATMDVFRIALEYARALATKEIITALLVGGAVGGWFGEWAWRRYD